MRQLYTVGFYLILPFILLRALWRTRKTEDAWTRLGERLGFYRFDKEQVSLWLHAVSYGEAVAAEPLLHKLKLSYPNLKIIITTMTLTGAIRVQATWQKDPQIRHIYIPYDIPFAINRFFNQINPAVAIIMETELWPNLLHIAGEKKIPLILANARLSPRSLKGYQRIKNFMAPFLKNITLVAAQSEQDAERFVALGVPQKQVSILGNLKFDITPPEPQISQGLELKKKLPFEHILVAASTHANEEEQLIDVFSRIQKDLPRTLLILIPRHPERFEEIAALCLRKGFQIARRSANELPHENTAIFLGDTMGELYFFYSLGDVAFVGGSLVPIGGHNLLEPAALKLPIVTGPHLFNFTAISDLLTNTGTLQTSLNGENLYQTFCALLKDKVHSQRIGFAGYEILAKNRGATERHLEVVSRLMSNPH